MVPPVQIFPLYITAKIVYDMNRHFQGMPDYFLRQEGYFLIRSILCVIFLIFVLILSLPQYAVLAIIRRKNRQKSAQIGQRFVVWAAKGLTFIAGTRVIVRGFENVPADTPVLYVGNHRSIFDILTLYPYLKNNTDPQIWENNIKGFYWLKEDVPETMYNCFDIENLVDFNNAEVRAMKACNDAVHEDGKLTFWCPYYRSTNDTGKHIGFIANQTDIFDYVILQPNHVFTDGLDYNIDLIKEATLQNAVLNKSYVAWGGEKKSSTMVGAEMESQSNLYSGKDREKNLERYQAYVDAYQDFLGKYSIAMYYGERNSVMSETVFNQLKDFLAGVK